MDTGKLCQRTDEINRHVELFDMESDRTELNDLADENLTSEADDWQLAGVGRSCEYSHGPSKTNRPNERK